MHKPDTTQAVKTILLLCITFEILFIRTGYKVLVSISIVLGLVGFFINSISSWIHIGWMMFGKILELVMPRIVLGIVFFFFLFPIAMLSRFFVKKDSLHLKNEGDSTFTVCDKKFDEQSFINPW